MARIYLSNETSDISGYKTAYVDTRSPARNALSTSVTNSTVGGDAIQLTDTAGGTALKWITRPLANAITMAATPVFCNIWGLESVATVNASVGIALYSYGSAEGATFWALSPPSTELTTTAARQAFVTTNGTGGQLTATSRLVVKLFLGAAGGTMAAGTVTVDYDGPDEGADGDTFIEINESIQVNKRQRLVSSVPTVTGRSKGAYIETIDRLKDFTSGLILNTNSTIQAAINDLGFERDRN